MIIIEVKTTFRVIDGVNIYTITLEHDKLKYDWMCELSDEKGRSTQFKHFGPLNNDLVTQLVKDNLIWL